MTYAQQHGDPTDVVGRRIGAYAIDGLLTLIAVAALVVPMFLGALETAPAGTVDCGTSDSFDDTTFDDTGSNDPSFCFEDGDEVRYVPSGEEGGLTAALYGIGFGVQALNLVVLQGLTGASVGKMLVGLRVIRQDGRKAGIGWAALRFVLLFVDSLCCFLPGAILVFTTKGHRRLGDMAAGTFVVRKDQVGTPPQVPGVTAPAYAAQVPGYGYQPQGGPGGWPSSPSAPSGWSAPDAGASGSTWSPPASTPGAGTAAPAARSGGEGPTWDAARNAYIQYDRDQAAWVQWDDGAGAWRPIDQ